MYKHMLNLTHTKETQINTQAYQIGKIEKTGNKKITGNWGLSTATYSDMNIKGSLLQGGQPSKFYQNQSSTFRNLSSHALAQVYYSRLYIATLFRAENNWKQSTCPPSQCNTVKL